MPPGRTNKRTDERRKRIIQLLQLGNTRQTAYIGSGLSKDTFHRWMNEDSTFRDDVERAEEEAVARNLALIQKAAPKEWKAAAWFLERKRPEDWRQRQEIDVRQIPDDRLLQLIEAAERRSGEAGDTDPDGGEESS